MGAKEILTVSLICLVALCYGADLYAAPTGESTQSCSREKPCSVLDAVRLSQTSDTIILLQGSYIFPSTVSISTSIAVEAESGSEVNINMSGNATAFWFSCVNCSLQGMSFAKMTTQAVTVTQSSDVTIRNCTFTQNLIVGQQTGVILVQGSATFESCTFLRNSLESGKQDSVSGGAVAIRPDCSTSNTTIIFRECVFKENQVIPMMQTSISSGGAISYLEPSCSAATAVGQRTLTISRSHFEQNAVSCAGQETGRHTRNFLSSGGAIDVSSVPPVQVTISDSNFKGSEVISDPSALQGVSVEGGAIHLALADVSSSILIRGCSFNSNIAVGGQFSLSSDSTIGGYCYGGAVSIAASVVAEIDDSEFIQNSCTGGTGSALSGRTFGGAVSFRTYERTATFVQRPLDRRVGLIITQSTFDGNFANSQQMLANPSGGAAAGGATFVWFASEATESRVLISNSRFVQNSVTGVISADANGGALALFWDVKPKHLTTKIENCIFGENRVVGSDSSPIASDYSARGGAVSIVTKTSVENHNPVFDNVTFYNNSAMAAVCPLQLCYLGGNAYGGAVSAYLSEVDIPSHNSFGTFANCLFEGNVAALGSLNKDHRRSASGGALWWKLSTEPAIIHNSTFKGNWAILHPLAGRGEEGLDSVDAACSGGAATLKDGALINKSSFVSNGAGRSIEQPDTKIVVAVEGGTINAAVDLNLQQVLFHANQAFGAFVTGHIVSADGASITIEESSFTSNEAFCSGFCAGGLSWASGDAKITSSSFMNNSITPVTPSAVAMGADIAGRFDQMSRITACSFSRSRASFGGSLAVSFDRSLPKLWGNNWESCQAIGGGAVWIISAPPTVVAAMNATFHNASIMNFSSNAASFGNDFSSPIASLAFVEPPPKVAWPSQPFRVRVGAYDIFRQLAIYPDVDLRINVTTDTPNWHFPPFIQAGLSSEGIHVGKDNLYTFEAIELTTPPGTHSMIQIIAGSTNIEPLEIATPGILVACCPPGYTSFRAIDAYGCRRCSNNEFNLDGNSTCQTCPEPEIPGLHVCFSPPDFQADGQTPKPNEISHQDAATIEEPSLIWVIHRGFFPVPSFTSPERLLPCLNAEACPQYNCTLDYNGTLPLLQCGHCHEELEHTAATDPHQQKSCLCEEGYSGRLCSMCVCDSHECYFSSDNEEHECHKCQTNSSWLLIVAIVFLQLSMIAFLVFRRSAATLFLTEFILVVILMILGIGETWLFQVVCVMALMFLLSAAENRRSNRAEAHRKGGHDHSHEAHKAAAKMTGIVKVILFFLQTVPAVVPSEAWPDWVGTIVKLLSALSLRISGLECISPSLFASPVGRFSFVMSLPILFAISIGVSVVFAAIINWSGIVPKAKIACLNLCCKKQTSASSSVDASSDSDHDDAPSARAPPSADEAYTSLHSSDSEIDVVTVDPHPEEESLLARDDPRSHLQRHEFDRRPRTFSQRVLPRIQFSILFILFAGHFELSNTVLAILRPCDYGYMKSYPFIKCSWTEDARYFVLYVMSVVFLFAYFLGIPALFGFFLLRHRKHIKEGAEHADDRIGFLYETFRREVYWFEMVWIARRLLISLIITFLPLSSGIQVAAMSIVLLTFLVVQRAIMPFSSRLVNYLELLASFVLLYSYIVGTEISAHFESFNERGSVKILFQSALWVLNAIVVVILVVALVYPSLSRMFRSIRKRCCEPRRRID